MNSIKILSFVAKAVGVILLVVPSLPEKWGLWTFLVASLAKDAVNRVGDLLDDGAVNQSFRS